MAHLPHADGKGRVSDARGVGARLIGGGGDVSEEDETRTARAFTEEGSVVGSAPYMSPEQVEGRQVDARSDIFSYGAVLYEMLTERRAFGRANRVATMAAVLKDGVAGSPKWSPDGQFIVFDARPGSSADVYTVPASGGR